MSQTAEISQLKPVNVSHKQKLINHQGFGESQFHVSPNYGIHFEFQQYEWVSLIWLVQRDRKNWEIIWFQYPEKDLSAADGPLVMRYHYVKRLPYCTSKAEFAL